MQTQLFFQPPPPPPAKVWHSTDRMPFGKYKGHSLKWLAENNPGLLQWWQKKQHVVFSPELHDLIRFSLFLLR